jgi:hypothetical protein
MRTPNTQPRPAADAGMKFYLDYKAHRPSSGVGSVIQEVAGLPTEVGPVFYNREKGQYWGIVHTTIETPLRDEPQQVLEDMVRLYLMGPLWQHHPAVAATFQNAQRLRDVWHNKHSEAQKEGKDPDRVHAVTEARGEFQGALSTLAYVLTAAGVNVAGYGGHPSADLALVRLDRWIELQK